ncbi:porin [Flavobacterium sp. JP2137]|uniref:porin n=1 Tax=Flavobacterium sp. JP2137 TaxID=3414510 RepID=UPI003D300F27
MKKCFFSLLFLCGTAATWSQSDSLPKPAWSLDGYVEVYYNYSFNQPENHELPKFLYSFNRHNEVSLNFGMIRATYDQDRVRGKLALMVGTYVQSNLIAEPDGLQHIYEANVGLKLSQSRDLWLDAGVFSSHIGFESAIGADVWTMTRSIAAENSPYFSTGIKLSYKSPNQKWFLSGLVLNGWQRMQRIAGNQTLAFGHQLTYQPSDGVLINSSSYIGSDAPDSLRQMRYFHDWYTELKISPKVRLIAGFDIGAQQVHKGSSSYDLWYSPSLIGKYQFNAQWSLGLRGEYYSDKKQLIISGDAEGGFQTWGYSTNLDYRFSEAVLWRIEFRNFNDKRANFVRNAQAVHSEAFIGSSLSIKF